MTSRLGNPDTPSDLAVRERLIETGPRHFIMVAGAGSGKTTSLIKALNHLSETRGPDFRRRGQQIACITYTDVAVGEIWGDVGHKALFHVSTIHSFLWSVMRPFQTDLQDWVRQRLDEKIAEAQSKIDKPKSRAATKEKAADDIARYERQLGQLSDVRQFSYGTGSDYANGVLGHSDILKLGPSLIIEHPLMRTIVAQRFPVIFVDESQDTAPDFVAALKVLAGSASPEFCLGFFGDPVQQIYPTGVGDIPLEENWRKIEKPENFRCPISVLNVINRIRAQADGLEQTRGRGVEIDGVMRPVQGTARLFVLPADDRRAERLAGVRTWLAEQNDDPLWLSDNEDGDVRLLIIVHRIAASRLGFANLYSALNDSAPEKLKNGLIDGTAWIVRPFLSFLLPLLKALRAGDDFEVMSLLRQHCPRLQAERLADENVSAVLAALQTDIARLDEQFAEGNAAVIGDVLFFVREHEIAELDERFAPVLMAHAEDLPIGDNTPENSPQRFLQCAAEELWGYQSYIEEQSPFSTQQGIKGAEFERVLVVVDDEESTTTTFSYGKYFGYASLSNTDQKNIEEGRETVIDRTRRLFYVCCSRAAQDLAVVVFAPDAKTVETAIRATGVFEAQDIYGLEL